MNLMIWVWLAAIVLFILVEAATAGLVSIWFVAGAVAALFAAIIHCSTLAQWMVFLAVSFAALLITRPLLKNVIRPKAEATNLDRVIGCTGRVTEAIDNRVSAGAVYVDGKTWTARSADGSVIPTGSTVRILKMEGVKLFVENTDILEEANV